MLIMNHNFQTFMYVEYDFVTWSSVIKLLNVNSNSRLHSHDVKYGSGSGQQVETIAFHKFLLNLIHLRETVLLIWL